ncbi:MAG: cysteine hydrolase [Pigmentiphaga sp.]|nr:cysteine hydrolase [Pigmentiphaga sp.]
MSAPPVLLALHYQNDVLHPDGKIRVGLGDGDQHRAALIASAGRLLAGAREREWPIIHVRIAFRPDYADMPDNMPIFRKTREIGAVPEGGWGSEFFAELAPLDSPREFVVRHTAISSFYGTPLMQLLIMLQAREVVVAGVATHSVVESTVRDAADRGYVVHVAADACAAADRQAHQAALNSMALIANVSQVDAILASGAAS